MSTNVKASQKDGMVMLPMATTSNHCLPLAETIQSLISMMGNE
jgi:hypothetical protein